MNECVVYHKHLAGMDTSDGYIGISKNFDSRMKNHHRDAFLRHSIYTVHEKMREHGDDVITTKIFEGSIEECFDYEEELRPRWHMGWNMAIGGGRPGSGWKPGKLWLDNRIWHFEYGERQFTANSTIADFARELFPDKTLGAVQGNVSQILSGKIPHAYGWELANAQLVKKVTDRCFRKWDFDYITDGNEIIKIHQSGCKQLAEHLNTTSKGLNIKYVITGTRTHFKGWELTTEQAWLDTTERLEFK